MLVECTTKVCLQLRIPNNFRDSTVFEYVTFIRQPNAFNKGLYYLPNKMYLLF